MAKRQMDARSPGACCWGFGAGGAGALMILLLSLKTGASFFPHIYCRGNPAPTAGKPHIRRPISTRKTALFAVPPCLQRLVLTSPPTRKRSTGRR